MSSPAPSSDDTSLNIGNYAVAFIDLLGQRAALRGQSLLPDAKTEEGKRQFIATLKESIGSISALQQQATTMMQASDPTPDSPLRAQLSPEKQAIWDESLRVKIATQRWSDGLMLFSCIGDEEIKCPVNAVYRMFALAGSLCYIGLASKRPLRGAIEIAWGVELHPGELYGAAVARAYELESEVADYPRIIIGPQILQYLDLKAINPGTDVNSQIDKSMAALCRKMLVQDADGHWLLHYLGDAFIRSVSQANHPELYQKAREFVLAQIQTHQKEQNSKLAFRYVHLLQYFNAHPAGIAAGPNPN